jgi:hypothetical protein
MRGIKLMVRLNKKKLAGAIQDHDEDLPAFIIDDDTHGETGNEPEFHADWHEDA